MILQTMAIPVPCVSMIYMAEHSTFSTVQILQYLNAHVLSLLLMVTCVEECQRSANKAPHSFVWVFVERCQVQRAFIL